MTKHTNVILSIVLSFMVLFSAIGYSALTDTLGVDGVATLTPQEIIGIYIYDVQLVSSTSGASSINNKKVLPTSLYTELNSGSRGSVTLKITVHNNSDITYWYLGQKFTGDYNNSLLGISGGITVTTRDHVNDSNSSFNTEDWVPPQTYRDFYVTYSFGNSASGKLINQINFQFGMKIDAVHDKFLAVLNDIQTNYGYDYLTDAFDDNYRDNGSAVIGNTGEYKYVFDTLFGSNMTVNVDGQEKPVTVMVCRETVDGKTTGDSFSPSGPSGCEYTVYITVDPLNSSTGEAVVYAVSYTLGSDGQWYQLGQLYTGKADMAAGGTFDVYSWEATPKTYEVADGIKYNAGMEQGDQYDKYLYREQLMSAADQDIFNDIDNSKIYKKIYDILVSNSPTAPGISGLQTAFDRAAKFFTNYNNGQEFKVKRDCTRAEILPYLEALQTALDYYNQVK